MLSKALLKEYDTYQDQPVILFEEGSDKYGYTLITADNRVINTSELYFEPVSVTDEKVVMRLNAGENSYIDFVYSVSPDSYVVKYDINQNNMAAVLNTSNSYINMFWEQKLRRQEKGKVFEERYSNLYYKFASDDVEYLDSGKDKSEDRKSVV